MKKLLLLGVILFVNNNLSAQKIDWDQIDSKADEFDLTSTYYLLNDNTLCALFVTPAAKRSQKTFENYVLRTYNNDFSDYSEVGIPPETPNRFIVEPFKNYTLIYGCDVEPLKTNPGLDHNIRSRLIVADKQMNPLVNMELKQFNEKFDLEGAPDMYINYDSSCVILANTEKPVSGPQAFPFGGGYEKKQYGITVINSNLDKVWTGLVDFEDIFGKGIQINKFGFNYINDHFYLIASVIGAPTKKMESSLSIVEFDTKGAYKIIHKEVFKMAPLKWDFYIDKNQLMTIGGFFKTTCKNLFSFQYSFKSKSLIKPNKTLVIDNKFINGNKETKEFFKPDFLFPFTLIPMEDGFIWYREDAMRSDNHEYMDDINLIKFDNNLNFKWVQRIHKSTREVTASSFFVNGKNLLLFYYDYEKNIKFGYKISMKTNHGSDLSLAMATVSPNGDVTKEIIYDVIETQRFGSLSKMFCPSPGKYILKGVSLSSKNFDDVYIGTIEVKDK